ncbi:MAG: ABC transporter substrate-binding protein [Candidatus Bathyarchaeia archaeon]
MLLMLPLIGTAVAEYDKYEQWGPRSKYFLMKFYANEAAEFTALEGTSTKGEIDVADWPLTKTYLDKWSEPPYSDYIAIVGSGPEYGMYIFDLNNNETMKNPVTNETENTYTCDVIIRHAIAHLINRDVIVSEDFEGMAQPLYVPIPYAAGEIWINRDAFNMHPFSVDEAQRILNEAGYVDTDADGIRNWKDGSNIRLEVFVRSDHEYRRRAGDRLVTLLRSIGIDCHVTYGSSAAAYTQVMEQKYFSIYTGGWSLGIDVPDTCFSLFHSSMYWHPGAPPNYGHYSNPESDALLEEAFYAPTMAEAVPPMREWQLVFVSEDWVPAQPIVSNIIFMAHRKYYSQWDGEEAFWGLPFAGIFNIPGRGISPYNNFWTFMNVYPADTAGANKAPGSYNIRWGWRQPSARRLNPIYGSWVWDWALMNWIYDSLMGINPAIVTEDKPWVAYQYDLGVWNNPDNPDFPQSTYVKFKIRDDVYWHDGEKFTVEDLRWQIEDLTPLLRARGKPYPWWYSSIADVHHVEVIDDQTITIYYNVRSYLALHWVAGLPLIPKHIWYGIVTDPEKDPYAHLADPTLTGSGPFKFLSYTPNAGAVLERNDNYFRSKPIDVRKTEWTYGGKNYVRATLYNYALEPITVRVKIGTLAEEEYVVPAAFGTPAGAYPGTVDIAKEVASLPTTVSISYTYHGWTVTGNFDFKANTIREDTNLDKTVNFLDGILLGAAFGSKPGDLNWDARVDIRTDGAINYLDGIMLGAYFGWPNIHVRP